LACSPALVLPDYPHASTKLIAFAGIVDRMIRGGHRGLVFSQFIKHLDLLKAYLDGEGIRYQYLDGSTPSRQRDNAVETFQTGTDPLFLISTRAGGQGINLTAAETVIHMDPWWNPAVEDQASDRAHRMGQQRPVTVYRLFAQGTVEEEILKLHRTKRDLADGLLEGADTATRLTADQRLNLMTRGI
jgi:SNF2 family DNA or RNA helicase